MRASRQVLGLVAALTLTLSACDALSEDSSPSTIDQDVLEGDDTAQNTGSDDLDQTSATGVDTDSSTAGSDTESSTATALPTGSDDLSASTGDTDQSTATVGAGDLGEATSGPEGSTDPDAPTVTPDDEELEDFSTDAVQGESSGEELLATSVRIGSHDGYDRVIFDLEGAGTPGFSISSVEEAVDEFSSERFDLDGDAILGIKITGTRDPGPDEVFEGGPGTYSLDSADAIEEVRLSGTFEGFTQAFIGLDDEDAPFRAYVLSNPARLVVDVSHNR